MISPKLSKNENERVAALDSYSIFHSPPEKEYDDITKLASYVCETPMSHISFINSDVQWEKSYLGIEGGETRREITFCGHTILDKKKPLIISDARIDIRFHDNPFVKDEPHIVFYAGFPLVNPEGHALGTLCVLDNEPRELNENQIEAIEEQNKKLKEIAWLQSHVLRAPLARMMGLIELIKIDTKEIPEELHFYLDEILNSSHEFDNIIKEISKKSSFLTEE